MPQAFAVNGITDGRIKLCQCTELLVANGRGECEMRGRYLYRGDIFMISKEYGLFLRGHMQYVHALARFARKSDQALCAYQGRGGVTPHRMRTWIAFNT